MKNFEKEIILELLENSQSKELISFLDKALNETIKYSGAGYFLTISHPRFPIQRSVLNEPNIQGNLGDTPVGYLIILSGSELMLECNSYDSEIFPKHQDLYFSRK